MSEQLKPTTNLAHVLSDIEAARSDLARKVLKLVSGFNGQIRKVDLDALLKDLFTREGITLGDEQ